MATNKVYDRATVQDAMRLMKLWHSDMSPSVSEDWFAITNGNPMTTKTLWDYIRATLENEGYVITPEKVSR